MQKVPGINSQRIFSGHAEVRSASGMFVSCKNSLSSIYHRNVSSFWFDWPANGNSRRHSQSLPWCAWIRRRRCCCRYLRDVIRTSLCRTFHFQCRCSCLASIDWILRGKKNKTNRSWKERNLRNLENVLINFSKLFSLRRLEPSSSWRSQERVEIWL